VKLGLEEKLPVCSQASNSLLWVSRKTAGSSTYANTSVILTVLRARPVYVLSLGGLNGLEAKVHTVGNCVPPLEKSGNPTKTRNNPAEKLTFTSALDKYCKSPFKNKDSHCLSNTGVFKGGKAAVFFQNKKGDQFERLSRKTVNHFKRANQTRYWHVVSDDKSLSNFKYSL